jgi:hypothetical protein
VALVGWVVAVEEVPGDSLEARRGRELTEHLENLIPVAAVVEQTQRMLTLMPADLGSWS